jgi:hypothetical protein
VTTHPPVPGTDRRATQRVPVQLMARFSATDSFQHIGDGVALDLSKSECKLCSTQVLLIGSFWDLYLTILPETSRPVLISEVRVIWPRKTNMESNFFASRHESGPGYAISSGST